MEDKKLDDYSRGFLERISMELTGYEQYIKIKKYTDEGDDSYLYIDIPCPSNVDSNLWISTYGDEITIGYDYFHCHFGYKDTDEEDYDEAIKVIKGFINEDIVTITGTREGKWTFSCFVKVEERGSLEIRHESYDAVTIKSWKGTYNEIITV